MAELHAVPPPGDPERHRGWTPERYSRTWLTIAGVFSVLSLLAFTGLLPGLAYAVLVLLLTCVALGATAARIRQVNRDRREWS